MGYVSSIEDLLREDRLAPLDPGSPQPAFRAALARPVDNLFSPARIHDPAAAQACRAGLWLYFDFLDESHRLSQDLDTVEGSYWHALMHRREPDFWNSKYWFRRVGRHAIFEPLRVAATELTHAAGTPKEAAFLVEQKAWDPMAFVDLCEAASKGQADEMLCRRIQRREWDLLFEYCYRQATT